ncbi:hypothetical protein B0H13DRAFT_2301351 [Mycena leptocephala]|nr:hypothetical protein B0H13DRAFT_2301351 [Mycena leptocephala]
MDALAQLLIGLAKANAEADTGDPTGGTDGSGFGNNNMIPAFTVVMNPEESILPGIMKQLLTNQHHIMPYAPETSTPAVPVDKVADSSVAVGDSVTVPKGNPGKFTNENRSLLQPSISFETWWNSRKALGFKHATARPGLTYPRPSSARAVSRAPIKVCQVSVMEQQRINSLKRFNGMMHDFYQSVCTSDSGSVVGSGSANTVISFAIDSD